MTHSAANIYKEKVAELYQHFLANEGLALYANTLISYARPAIAFTTQASETPNPVGVSRYGGAPDLPRDYPYPHIKGKPCIFLAQLSLAELKPFDIENLLPSRGLLSFFIPQPGIFEGSIPLYFEDTAQLYRIPTDQHLLSERRMGSFDVTVTIPETSSQFAYQLFEYKEWFDEVRSAYTEHYMDTLDRTGDILGYPSTVNGWNLESSVHSYDGIDHNDVTLERSLEFLRLFQCRIHYEDIIDDEGYSWNSDWLFSYTIHRQDLIDRQFAKAIYDPECGD